MFVKTGKWTQFKFDDSIEIAIFKFREIPSFSFKETCDIAWIDKDDFNEFLKTVDKIDRMKSREFLCKIFPTTSVIEEDSLEFLLRHCVYQEYPPESVSTRLDSASVVMVW